MFFFWRPQACAISAESLLHPRPSLVFRKECTYGDRLFHLRLGPWGGRGGGEALSAAHGAS